MKSVSKLAALATIALLAQPVFAQQDQEAESLFEEIPPPSPDNVYDETWLAVGLGGRYSSTYPGSDDYRFRVVPVIAGSIKNIDFTPRAAGLAVDIFQKRLSPKVKIDGGPVGRVRFTRTGNIEDPVVEAAGELDEAVELGLQGGVTIRRIFSRYDRISVSADIRWDVAGAHSGMIFDPGISYRTPLSEGMILSASIGADYADGEFSDYYFSVNPQQSADSGLPEFVADSGWYKAGGSVGIGIDLDGNLRNGGLVLGVVAGYSRVLGDAADTPFTSIRGDRDQYHVSAGMAFVF